MATGLVLFSLYLICNSWQLNFIRMKKILVPTDFSFLANCAVNFATQLAVLESADIKLLHVIEPPDPKMNSTGEVTNDPLNDVYVIELVKQAKKKLHDLLDTYCDRNVSIEYEVAIGNPASSILEEIRNRSIETVIMGARGHSWLESVLIGSTTERIVRKATCPVITLKCSLEKLQKLQRIVYHFNPEEQQTKVIQELKKLTHLLNAHLYLLAVVMPAKFKPTTELNNQMKAFVTAHELENFSTHIYIDKVEEEGIMHFAEEINADLIAIGTDSHTNILQLLTTNLREDLVNHSQRPVWTFNTKSIKPVQGSEIEENYTVIL